MTSASAWMRVSGISSARSVSALSRLDSLETMERTTIRGVVPVGIQLEQVREQQHQIAVALLAAPPDVDLLLLAGFVGPVQARDDRALASAATWPAACAACRSRRSCFSGQPNMTVLECRPAMPLAWATSMAPRLEVGHHVDLAEGDQALAVEVAVHLLLAAGRPRPPARARSPTTSRQAVTMPRFWLNQEARRTRPIRLAVSPAKSRMCGRQLRGSSSCVAQPQQREAGQGQPQPGAHVAPALAHGAAAQVEVERRLQDHAPPGRPAG